jgi:hypothetical protein
MRDYRLPDWTTTTDPDKYCDEWYKLASIAQEFFAGYKVSGFDPSIHLTNGVESLTLTVEQVILLKKYMEKK